MEGREGRGTEGKEEEGKGREERRLVHSHIVDAFQLLSSWNQQGSPTPNASPTSKPSSYHQSLR